MSIPRVGKRPGPADPECNTCAGDMAIECMACGWGDSIYTCEACQTRWTVYDSYCLKCPKCFPSIYNGQNSYVRIP